MKILLNIIGIIMTVYGTIVLLLISGSRLFNFFYLFSGILLLLAVNFYPRLLLVFNKGILRFVSIILLIFLIFFIIAETMMVSFSLKGPDPDADYLIILGSQLRENGPSADFAARIDKGYEYLLANPATKVIIAGGQGPNEPESEANGGAKVLLAKGIAAERIIIEDRSKTTYQNLANARELIAKEKDPTEAKVVVVSSLFHLYRAAYLTRKLNYGHCSFSGSHGLFLLLPHYYTREFFALIKEIILPGP